MQGVGHTHTPQLAPWLQTRGPTRVQVPPIPPAEPAPPHPERQRGSRPADRRYVIV